MMEKHQQPDRSRHKARPAPSGAAGPARPGGPPPHAGAATIRPLPLAHPAFVLALLVTAALLVLGTTTALLDYDVWQHLTVGRFIWEQHRFPTTQLWTWPTYGTKDVDYAWGFEALVWPCWKLGGLLGLYAWRWLTTLAAFAFAWAAARRLGAKGFAPLVVIALCAMIYRIRSQVRPETVAAVLLMAEVWLLESRRHGARVHPGWLVLIAWAWANTHISYYLFFVVLGFHVFAASLPPRRAGAPPARALWLAALAAAAISFVNPSGWRTLWQPFEFWRVWRQEPIYSNIGEMQGVDWSTNWLNGLPLVLAGWPLLALWRARRSRLDLVEFLMCACFSATLLFARRFLGVYALVACVYVSRDLDELVRARTWPAWTRPPWTRTGIAAACALLAAGPDLAGGRLPVEMSIPAGHLPAGASDFIRRRDLHGRLFNQYDYGGYLCFRFWPRRDQLPFMGIHQEGSQELRRLYQMALTDPKSWERLDAQHRFDYVVLRRSPGPGEQILPTMDRDTIWARVFADDAAYVYVRRDGPFARLAADSAYAIIPAGWDGQVAFSRLVQRDTSLSRRAERDLRREIAGSPYHARALSWLSNLALSRGAWEEARLALEEALRIEPMMRHEREKLGVIALRQGRPREALRWFEEERRIAGSRAGLSLRRGQVAQAEGNLGRARAFYLQELRHDPGSQEARDSLASLSRQPGR